MTIRINNISLSINEDIKLLKNKVAKKLRLNEDEFKDFKILKESLDARKKDNIKFNYSVIVSLDNEDEFLKKVKDKDIIKEKESKVEELVHGNIKLNNRPIVIGFGPAGIFSALTLAEQGYKPIVFERGEDADSRTKTVEEFWSGKSDLNPESNVQFGEGGAGTFSDGKLTTRIKDKKCGYVLEELVKAGAPEEIVYVGKPHVGTDILKDVVKNLREKIKKLGGEVHFNSKMEKLNYENGKLSSIVVNDKIIPCDVVILAVGHSSRDTYEMLVKEEIFVEPKPFAIGVRIEHPQNMIDISQYGECASHERLKAAEYRLAYQSEKYKRGVYSFCMCPGGVVVAASSERNRLVSNGMSYHSRDLENANSALVVTVGPDDFEGEGPLAGMEFQRKYEELAYKAGGGNYKAPVQLVGDFIKDKISTELRGVTPSYTAGYIFADLRECLPSYVIETLKEGIGVFDRKIKGYGREDAVLTGIETRTSAPVKIVRNEGLESVSVEGLYPCGEGAGFAGGIISAAVDGIKVAEKIILKYSENLSI